MDGRDVGGDQERGDLPGGAGGAAAAGAAPPEPPEQPEQPGGDVDQEPEQQASGVPGPRAGGGGVERTPGVDLLLRVGAQHPGYLLTGPTLADQGRVVDGMLAEGWTAGQVREAVTGRPLPETITTSVGAIVARRLQDAAVAGPPMGPAAGPATPTAPAYGTHLDPVRPDCPGEGADGLECRASVPSGYEMCWDCLAMPACPQCAQRRYDPADGPVCAPCAQAGPPLPAVEPCAGAGRGDGCPHGAAAAGPERHPERPELCGRCAVTAQRTPRPQGRTRSRVGR